GMLNFAGTLSSAMSIDGLPAQKVADALKSSFPQASQANAKIVFHKTDGKPFSKDQQAAVQTALAEVAKLAVLDSVVDPFKIDAEKRSQLADLADAKHKLETAPDTLRTQQAKIDAGRAQLTAAQAELDANAAKLAAGVKQLSDGIAQLQAGIDALNAADPKPAGAEQQLAGMNQQLAGLQAQLKALEGNRAKLADGQKQIDANLAKLNAGQKAIDEARASLGANATKLANGEALAAAAAKFETVSSDRQTAIATVLFKKSAATLEVSEKNQVIQALEDRKIPNVAVEYSQELTQSVEGILGVGELIGLIIAGIVLFVMLGSMIASGLPVMAAILGVGVSATLTMALSGVIEMTSTTPVLGVMLGLAVGIDYSLFILNRHRRQLKAGMPVDESIALANGTSGNAVLFAGLTVIIALVALNLTGIGFLGMMGNFAGLSIAIAVLIALTFTPAVMKLAGLKILSRRERRKLADSSVESRSADAHNEAELQKNKSVWATKHPWLALALTFGVLLTIAIPASSMRLGLPDGSAQPTDTTQYRAYSLITKSFGAGANGQIAAVVTLPEKLDEDALLALKAGIATELMKLDNVAAAVPAADSKDGKILLFQVLPKEGPTAASTEQVVRDLRAESASIAHEYKADFGVTGLTATNIDLSKKLADALPLYLGVVLALSMLLMIAVFRSILVPLLGSLGFLLTVAATLGAVVAVYQWGWLGQIFDVHDPGPVLNFLPTMLIGILFGLAMDYQLFLVSGMREAFAHGESPKQAVNHGVRAGRPVVIAAAIIMVSVFGSFAFSHLAMVRPIGLGLAVGVLADAFLVRLLFVPATMRLLGKAAWWMPKWLDRLLPDLDVEGAKLERQ
ncbi:MAG: MMPL family transporter, partial [Actinomycetales bacterium]|nr:MMPL family transporter [Actinomycetales bacterium]